MVTFFGCQLLLSLEKLYNSGPERIMAQGRSIINDLINRGIYEQADILERNDGRQYFRLVIYFLGSVLSF